MRVRAHADACTCVYVHTTHDESIQAWTRTCCCHAHSTRHMRISSTLKTRWKHAKAHSACTYASRAANKGRRHTASMGISSFSAKYSRKPISKSSPCSLSGACCLQRSMTRLAKSAMASFAGSIWRASREAVRSCSCWSVGRCECSSARSLEASFLDSSSLCLSKHMQVRQVDGQLLTADGRQVDLI
jgi:hypothetical protein